MSQAFRDSSKPALETLESSLYIYTCSRIRMHFFPRCFLSKSNDSRIPHHSTARGNSRVYKNKSSPSFSITYFAHRRKQTFSSKSRSYSLKSIGKPVNISPDQSDKHCRSQKHIFCFSILSVFPKVSGSNPSES